MNTLPLGQRGVAALGVTLMLLFAMTLMVGIANRNLVFEQRSSANQIRATRAFEAAEAGLEWAQAMLTSGSTIGDDCAPSAAAGSTSFRERVLDYDAASRRFSPKTWTAAGASHPLQAACVLADAGWTCGCPSAGHPTLTEPAEAGAHPAFAVLFIAATRAGMVQAVVTGCDHFAPACLPGLAGSSAGRASATSQVTLALLPALATPPVAALTARGNLAAVGALTLVNTDAASGGLTAQAGGSIAMPAASLVTIGERPGAASLAAGDAQLTATDAERLLTRFLGLDRAHWQQRPGVRSVTCTDECGASLADAIGPDSAHRMLWVAGELQLDGPFTLGSPDRPVILVVEGPLRLGSGVVIHGLVVSLAANWDTSGSAGAQLHGALIALGGVSGNGALTIAYDPAVLARLGGELGSFVRVPGSWRDF